jgi:DNA-binding Lrp family transcriptional regulator
MDKSVEILQALAAEAATAPYGIAKISVEEIANLVRISADERHKIRKEAFEAGYKMGKKVADER